MLMTRAAEAQLSVVVPVLNEETNIVPFMERLDRAMQSRSVSYVVYFVDDNSTDNTWNTLQSLSESYPLIAVKKIGARGKASALLQGLQLVKTPYAAVIDGDLQYPPEALAPMLSMIISDQYDVVVANRQNQQTSLRRRIITKGFRFVFGKLLWRLDVDVQSGMKVFKANIIQRLRIEPTPWTFDLEFLIQSRDAKYRLGSFDIHFDQRYAGHSKLKTIPATYQIGKEALLLRVKPRKHLPHTPNERGYSSGFHFKGKSYTLHNNLPFHETAARRFSHRQSIIGLLSVLVVATLTALFFNTALKVIVGFLSVLYFADLLLNLLLVYRSYFKFAPEKVSNDELRGRSDWPAYTVFCPLYKETAVLPQFTAAMEGLEYPKDKLEVLLLLEANDTATIAAARAMTLPDYFKIVIVPDSMPKTKPKACNYGLRLARGTYAVIYDAEDIPDPLQLKKAVITFERSKQKVGCVQAKLNYYNWDQNLLTRLFTLEYSLWFDLILPGLQSIKAPIPLGGTSNHFRVGDLRSFGGWDPFNVTEDADLGIRLSKHGYSTLVLDSVTMEEANSQYRNWIRQRSRWIKGYIQTYFVHTRKIKDKQTPRNFAIFQLIIGGKVMSALVNPLLWAMTAIYFIFRNSTGRYIHSLYSAPIFYLALTTLLVGNFLYVYMYMMGAAKRNHSELIVTALMVPMYWLMISIATVKAIYEFIVKPFHWQKTTHGLHLKAAKAEPEVLQPGLQHG